jgi:hypothetical protein
MSSANEMSLRKQLKNTYENLLSKSTFHGVSQMVSSEKLIQKLFWALIMLSMYAYFSASVVSNVLEFLKYPVVTNINTIYEKEAVFPAVTFCYFSQFLQCSINARQCPISSILPRGSFCHVFNSGLNSSLFPLETLKSTIPGVANGLRLTLDVNQGNHINLIIYNQSTDLDINKAMRIYRGTELNLAISRVFYSKLGKPHSNCKKEYVFEPKPLDILNLTSYPYFQSECFYLCQVQQEMEICNQTTEFNSNFQFYFTNKGFFFKFYNQQHRLCYQKDPSLLDSVTAKFQNLGANTICERQCPIECDSVSFSLKVVTNYIDQNFSRINIYYEDFFYTSITEEPKTSFDSFIGTIGGLSGLFLGASLMSFFELVDLAFSLFYVASQYKKIRPQKTVIVTISSYVQPEVF